MNGRERTLAALRGAPVDTLPIWLMRQAGRFLPEYRAVRADHGFLELVHDAKLCTEVALQPLRRFDLDATIVFSDILVVPDAMGAQLRFVQGDGPSFARPVREPEDVDRLDGEGLTERLGFVYEAVAALRVAARDHALYGFAGSPWTLFCYLVQGEGSPEFARAKGFLHRHPVAARRLLDVLADAVTAHLRAQIAAGADVVQVFDTWGGILPASAWTRLCAPGLRRIVAALGDTPSVLFVRAGAHLVEAARGLGFTALSVHDTVDLDTVRGIATQGNLDPTVLLAGDDAIVAEVRRIHGALGGRRDHVWNLGHGVLPATPPESVASFVAAVRELG
jgi:uroporphyrinogen decarboxylase